MGKKILITAICCIMTMFFGSKVHASNTKYSMYRIDIVEKINAGNDDIQELQDMVSDDMSYQGFIVLDKNSNRYVLVYSEDLANKAMNDRKIFNGLYKTHTRGIDNGTYEYSKGKLTLSDSSGDYSHLYNAHIGSVYEIKNGIESLNLQTKVTKMNEQ